MASRAWIVAVVTLLGVVLSAGLAAFIACLLAEGVIHIATGGGLIWMGGTITIGCFFFTLFLTPFPWIVGGIIGLAALIGSSIYVIAECSSICNANVEVGGSGAIGQALTTDGSNPYGDTAGPIVCESAAAALASEQRYARPPRSSTADTSPTPQRPHRATPPVNRYEWGRPPFGRVREAKIAVSSS